MSAVNRTSVLWNESDNLQFFDHFSDEPLANFRYVVTATDSGSAAVGNVRGGVVAVVPSDGTVADNDETYLATINALWTPVASKPISVKVFAQYAEANTDDANIAIGLASSVAANLIVDDGGGMRTSGSIICFYKVDGGTAWKCVTRNGSTVTDSQSTTPAGGSSYNEFTINIIDQGPVVGSAMVTFEIDGVTLQDSNSNPIVHYFPYTGATAMQLFGGVKNGSANLETLNIDKWLASQVV